MSGNPILIFWYLKGSFSKIIKTLPSPLTDHAVLPSFRFQMILLFLYDFIYKLKKSNLFVHLFLFLSSYSCNICSDIVGKFLDWISPFFFSRYLHLFEGFISVRIPFSCKPSVQFIHFINQYMYQILQEYPCENFEVFYHISLLSVLYTLAVNNTCILKMHVIYCEQALI